MKVLPAVIILCLLSSVAYGQAIVEPNVIEISMDGADFLEASAYVSDIEILDGIAPPGTAPPGTVINVGRGVVIQWVAQLGTPHEDEIVRWKTDTGLLPDTVNTFRIRFRWSHDTVLSPYSDPSDEITLVEVGKPGKPTVIIF